MTGQDYDVGMWAAAINFNHSLAGVSTRLLSCEASWQGDELIISRPAWRLGTQTVKVMTLGGALLVVLTAWACSWKGLAKVGTSLSSGQAPSAEALGFALVLILMPLLSPHSSKPHYCTLVLPGFCLARAALVWPSRRLLACLVVSAACAIIPNKALLGGHLYDSMIWWGVPTLGALVLFAGCCLALVHPPAAPAALPEAVEHESHTRRAAA
jgi:hypothetical protein